MCDLTTLPPAALRAKLDEIEKAAYETPVTVGFAHTESLCALARKLLDDLYASEAERDRRARLLGSLGQAVLAHHQAEETDV